MTPQIVRATSMRITRLDAAGTPVGDPISVDVVMADMIHEIRSDPRVHAYTISPGVVEVQFDGFVLLPGVWQILTGMRLPSPLLARHRRRRHR